MPLYIYTEIISILKFKNIYLYRNYIFRFIIFFFFFII